jgi:hypothetical protein
MSLHWSEKTPGQIAFEAWCSSPGSLIPFSDLQSAWDRCSDITKGAWERVGDAFSPTLPNDAQEK